MSLRSWLLTAILLQITGIVVYELGAKLWHSRQGQIQTGLNARVDPNRKTNPSLGIGSVLIVLDDEPGRKIVEKKKSQTHCDRNCELKKYIPLSSTGRGPRWVAGFIDPDDYPEEAQDEGIQGVIRLILYINKAGIVKHVMLLKGIHPILNEFVLKKIRLARFEPARDQAGMPVPVKLIMPIRFRFR